MPAGLSKQFVADVKCYYCGHVSGQIIGDRDQRLRVGNFVPRPGYAGPPLRPGARLRCERCGGPVFLEDAVPAPQERPFSVALRQRRRAGGTKAA